MICTACRAEVPAVDRFCEHCGKPAVDLAAEVSGACPCETGAYEVDEEGFCQSCGHRVRRPASDHVEQELSGACAAVSDRGLRHESNQDRFALAQGGLDQPGWALVVCDGVSSTRRAEDAAHLVATTVLQELLRALEQPEERGRAGSEPGAKGSVDAEGAVEAEDRSDTEAIRAAIGRGSEALKAETGALRWSTGAPSTTVVAVLVRGRRLTVGWAGDSRAYWISERECIALTRDHSWMRAVVDAGEGTREQSPEPTQAHAITRWIGADAGERAEPELGGRELHGAGTLLLCTDGLWNYAEGEAEFAAVVRSAQAEAESALVVAQRLARYANEQGGQDNVTVAVLRLAEEQDLPSPGLIAVN